MNELALFAGAGGGMSTHTTIRVPVEARKIAGRIRNRSGEPIGYIVLRALMAAERECRLHDKRLEYARLQRLLKADSRNV